MVGLTHVKLSVKNMIEPRSDMFPDKSETNQEEQPIEGTQEEAQIVKEDVKIEEEPVVPKAPPGYVEYGALHEERKKRKDLEAKLKEFEGQATPAASVEASEYYSDEGKALKAEINALTSKISSYERKDEESKVYSNYPVLKDKQDEFQEYLEENPELSLTKAAKLFIFENKLNLEDIPQRKGLEKPSSGSKSKPETGMTEADVKRLREDQPRLYEKMIKEGKLNPDTIK